MTAITDPQDRLALVYDAEAYSFRDKVMGRQSAGTALIKAIAAARIPTVHAYSRHEAATRILAEDLRAAGAPETVVQWVPETQPARLAEAGLLYRPDPAIAVDAWNRLRSAGSRAYSLCGITHTTASHGVMENLAGLLTAPLEEWDAVICTSRAVRDSVRVIVEAQGEYLRERVGASRFTLPQMPVIPLGVHAADYAGLEARRDAARAALGIAPEGVVVLFVGRLSFHGKAHPLPMYLGLEAVAREAPITLVQAGWFANEPIGAAFRTDAARLCPSVDYRIVDGRDPAALRDAWAAADIFTSLSDNIQETFGLTPLEAMAAGLPVVVSDWDGYRDTVRDGIDGFRVPTLAPAAGQGVDFADRFDFGLDTYDHYCGYVGQFTAVDVEAATRAYRSLVTDPDLRRRMGEAGRLRAGRDFDWSEIFRRYQDLWCDLGERRRSAPSLAPGLSRRRRPDRDDPFKIFGGYPTLTLGPATRFRRRPMPMAEALARRELATVAFAGPLLPPPYLISAILDLVPERDWITGGQVAAQLATLQPGAVARALVWLAKVGALDFRGEDARD